MIAIYNEIGKQWTGDQLNDKAVCLYKNKNFNRKGTEVRRSIHIITYNSIFNESIEEITKKLAEYKNMSEVAMLTDKNTTIIFSKKDYNPFITQRDKHLKDVLLISINLKGRKVIDIPYEGIFLLEGFILGGELSMITSLNDLKSTLQIKLYDGALKKLVVYTFGKDEETNMPYVKVTEEEAAEDVENSTFQLKKFRPAKPTYTILAHEKDKEQLQKVVDTQNHNIVTYNKGNIDNVIQGLVDQNYKAVTLFINAENIDDTTKKIYGAAVAKLSKKFRVFYELLNTKKVLKIKY